MTEFTKANGLKLLTHSDPEVMLDEAALEREVGGEEKLAPDYIIRYQAPNSIKKFSFKTYIFCGSFAWGQFLSPNIFKLIFPFSFVQNNLNFLFNFP